MFLSQLQIVKPGDSGCIFLFLPHSAFALNSNLFQHIPCEFTLPVNPDLSEKYVCVDRESYACIWVIKTGSNKVQKMPQFLSFIPCLLQQTQSLKTKYVSAAVSSLLCLYTAGSLCA